MNYDRVICPVCNHRTTVQIPDSGEQVIDVAELGDKDRKKGYKNLSRTSKSNVDWNIQECEECFNEIVIGYQEESDSGLFF